MAGPAVEHAPLTPELERRLASVLGSAALEGLTPDAALVADLRAMLAGDSDPATLRARLLERYQQPT